MNKKPNKLGRLIKKDGRIYVGEVLDMVPNGIGTLYTSEGTKLSYGKWVNDIY